MYDRYAGRLDARNRELRRYHLYKSDPPPTHNATDSPDCGTGIILITRDCMAIPELSGFPRRGVRGLESFFMPTHAVVAGAVGAWGACWKTC